jgi:hypothetical protein
MIKEFTIIFLAMAMFTLGLASNYHNEQQTEQLKQLNVQLENMQQLVYFFSQYRYDVGDLIKYFHNEEDKVYDIAKGGTPNAEVRVIREVNITNEDNNFKVEYLCQSIIGGKEMGNIIRLTPMQMAEDVELIEKNSGE